MSQKTRATGVVAVVPARRGEQDLERLRVGLGEHVGLLHPAEAVDRRAVEGHPLVESVLQLGRRDGERLGRPEDVGEPELDEADAPLLDGPQHVFLLALHCALRLLFRRHVLAGEPSTR